MMSKVDIRNQLIQNRRISFTQDERQENTADEPSSSKVSTLLRKTRLGYSSRAERKE